MTMKFLHRLAVYVLVTAIIEVPSILTLYRYGYPEGPSSDWFWVFLIVENLCILFLWSSAIGGPVPGQGLRDISLDLLWGVVSMFVIIAVLGETLNWLIEETGKLRRTSKRFDASSPKISGNSQTFLLQFVSFLLPGLQPLFISARHAYDMPRKELNLA
jgi:hypothetical protein